MRSEIQLRTIAEDFWATLEHQMKYKKNLPHEDMIRNELKKLFGKNDPKEKAVS